MPEAWIRVLVVGLGGFVGAIARYGLSGLVHRLTGERFPAGTLVVNVLGCVVLGALMTLVEDRPAFSPRVRLLVATGFLGSLTTFSTFGWETVRLVRDQALGLAMWSVFGNLALGLLGVLLGRALVRWLG